MLPTYHLGCSSLYASFASIGSELPQTFLAGPPCAAAPGGQFSSRTPRGQRDATVPAESGEGAGGCSDCADSSQHCQQEHGTFSFNAPSHFTTALFFIIFFLNKNYQIVYF